MEAVVSIVFLVFWLGFWGGGICAFCWSAVLVGRALARMKPLAGRWLWVSTLVLASPAVFLTLASLVVPPMLIFSFLPGLLIAAVLWTARQVTTGRSTSEAKMPLVIVAVAIAIWGVVALAGLTSEPTTTGGVLLLGVAGLWLVGCAINAWYIRLESRVPFHMPAPVEV